MKIKLFRWCLYVAILYYFVIIINSSEGKIFGRFFSSIIGNQECKLDNIYTNKYKKEFNLTSFQKEALVGILLGDGFLERLKPHYNTRLRLEQSYPEKEEYFNHLYDIFKPLVKMSPGILTRKADKRTGLIYQSIYFWTLAFPCLNEYYDLFYKDKTKIVPSNLYDLVLKPLLLV